MLAKLTESAIAKATKDAAAKKARVELVDADCRGLRLRIEPSGRRKWALMCRDRHGRLRRFEVGDYAVMGLAAARVEAIGLREKVRKEGADPVNEARRERAVGMAAKAGQGTLTALLDLYGQKDGAALKSWPASRKRVEVVFASLLKKPVATLTAVDFQLAADGYSSKNSAAFAVRTIRPVLRA